MFMSFEIRNTCVYILCARDKFIKHVTHSVQTKTECSRMHKTLASVYFPALGSLKIHILNFQVGCVALSCICPRAAGTAEEHSLTH